MKLPEDREQVAKAARCKPRAIRLIQVRPGQFSWRIPVFTPGQEFMSLLWVAQHGRVIKKTPDGLRAYKEIEQCA